MKKYILLLAFLSSLSTYSQINLEKKVTSKVNEVTVFLESAQITRKKTVTINKGTTVLRFTKLSPFIDGKSIQVKTTNDVEIQSVNFEKNYLDKQTKSDELLKLENDLKAAQKKLDIENTYLSINKEETEFLQSNRNIGGKNQTLTAINLKNAATYYGTKYKTLKLEALKIRERINTIRDDFNSIRNQINSFSSKKEFASGEALVKIKATKTTTIQLELVYNVANAGWFPTYDIRVKDINSPLHLVYKANVKQNTKVDWTNVKLSFSSSDPSVSSEAPELKTYFLNYNSLPPVYTKNIKTVSGIVSDNSGALPGVSVLIDGTTIGTETNFDGYYSITIPKNASTLTFSYLGYSTVKRNIYSSNINVQMKEDANVLDEVVVTGYGNRKPISSVLAGKISGVQITNDSRKKENNYSIPTNQIVNQTTVNFEIASPYSLKSDNKNYSVGMKTYELNVDYQYYSIPKIDKNAFLIASADNWEKLNLLEGEANIYFEGTYIGKSLLDTRFITDKLKISLGRDKNIIVNREKTKDFTTRQFIGSKKQENRAWNISIKNNKSQKISISIFDQIPVSTLEEIKVELDKSNTGEFNAETGEILWKFELNPSSTKDLSLRYSVKYPKNRVLTLE
ncbi:mucoidy inhibitor MuiA family protein [Polaribacter uvawellassae]|uniref:mucoidy inhibitor MuiA family protein n=1 Tax=Polaribacter uvawellassae TaxID=3133495 RepID=UPI003219FE70